MSLPVSVGVFAHDEAGSIAGCLLALGRSRTESIRLAEVLIVSSGSTDGTDERAAELARQHPGWRLLRQPLKEGKASAVNLFLREARHPLCVLTNADTILREDTLERLCAPLQDPEVGIVGGRPVPVAVGPGLVGRCMTLFWELHHELCRRALKTGELIAFRRVFERLRVEEAGADEDWIHGEVLRLGLRAVYAPSAVVYNRVPATLADFMAHRQRLAVQHHVLAHRCGFRPASRRPGLLLRAAAAYLAERPRRLPLLLVAGALEAMARARAAVGHHLLGETGRDWRPLASSRGITLEDVRRFEAAAGLGAAGEKGRWSVATG